jgi:hypothetical protein
MQRMTRQLRRKAMAASAFEIAENGASFVSLRALKLLRSFTKLIASAITQAE